MYASSACYNDDTKKGLDYGNCQNNATCATDYSSKTCKSTNWLLDTNNWFWAVSPSSISSIYPMLVEDSGYMSNQFTNNSSVGLRQSVYLDTNINYVSGDGTTSNPFIIK